MTNTSLHPSEQLVGYSEALATWTTRYLDPSGYECLLSFQAETGSDVLTKAEGALERLTELKCVPHTQRQPNNGNEQKKKNILKSPASMISEEPLRSTSYATAVISIPYKT